MSAILASRTEDACLAAVVPAGARRFRLHDEGLAAALTLSGAEVVADGTAEVEIGPSWAITGDADVAVVPVGLTHVDRDVPTRVGAAGSRIAWHVRVRAEAERARAALRRRGYATTEVLLWDNGHAFRLPDPWRPPPAVRLSERFPQRAVVVGHRGRRTPTLLEAALADAGRAVGRRLVPFWPQAKPGSSVVVTDAGVLRVAVGPATRRIEGQRDALSALRACEPPPAVERVVPWLFAEGTIGIARWSLERRMPGVRASRLVTAARIEAVVDFLADLSALGSEPAAEPDLAPIAALCTPAQRAMLDRVAARAEAALANVPRGFGHGDLWHGNLLFEGDRIGGVLDWETAGPGRLPLVDLLHLLVNMRLRGGSVNWGPVVVRELLPAASRSGERLWRSYCRRVGFDADAAVMRALVARYWMDYLAFQLRTFEERSRRHAWVRNNLDVPLRALAARGGV